MEQQDLEAEVLVASPGCGANGTNNTGGGAGSGLSNGGTGGPGIVVVKELSKASGVWSMQSQFQAQSLKEHGLMDQQVFY
jgi:hypothetical protein